MYIILPIVACNGLGFRDVYLSMADVFRKEVFTRCRLFPIASKQMPRKNLS
jgi:hypothetical protein